MISNPASMVLANAIDFPILIACGFIYFAPLVLATALVESVLLWFFLRIKILKSILPLLAANTLSLLGGALLTGSMNDSLVTWLGLRTIIDFVKWYWLAALFLAAIYYAKSVVIEGLYIARRKLSIRFGVSRSKLWMGVIFVNIGSYLLLGPLYYHLTGPGLDSLRAVQGPQEVTGSSDRIYYLNSDTGFLCTIQANGANQQVLVSHRMTDYIVSQDQETFVYLDDKGVLYFYKPGMEQPIVVGTLGPGASTREFDISRGNRYVAYYKDDCLTVFDLESQMIKASVITDFAKPGYIKMVAWQKNDAATVCVWVDDQAHTWRLIDNILILDNELTLYSTQLKLNPLANYRSGRGGLSVSQSGASLSTMFRRGTLHISLPNRREYVIGNKIGDILSNFGFHSIWIGEADFVGDGYPGLIVFKAGGNQIYVYDSETGNIALLCQGRNIVTFRRVQAKYRGIHIADTQAQSSTQGAP